MRENTVYSLGERRSSVHPFSARRIASATLPEDEILVRLEAVERLLDRGDVETAAGELDRMHAATERSDHAPGIASSKRRLAWMRGRELPDLDGALAMVPDPGGQPLPRRQALELLALGRVAVRRRWFDVVHRVLRCLKSRGPRSEAPEAVRVVVLRGTMLVAQGRRREGVELLEAALTGAAPARTVQEAVLACVEVGALGAARGIFEAHRAVLQGVWGSLIEARLLIAEGHREGARRVLPAPTFPVPRYLAATLGAAAGEDGAAGVPAPSRDPVLAAECQWVLEEFALEEVKDLVTSTAEERSTLGARSRDLLMASWLAAGDVVIDVTRRRISCPGVPDLEMGGRLTPMKLLRELVVAGAGGLAKAALFERFTGQRYNPEVHDRNVYSTVKRLRAILQEWAGGRDWIVTSGMGRFSVDPAVRWRLVEEVPLAERWNLDPVQDAVLGALDSGPLDMAELEARTGRGETTLRRALRALLARALVVRLPGHDRLLYRKARRLMGAG